jgi:hypothetical protein
MAVTALNAVRIVLVLRVKSLLQLDKKSNCANVLKNVPRIYGSMALVFYASSYGFPLPIKSRPTPSLIFVLEKHYTTALECMRIFPEICAAVLLDFCAQ